MSSATTVSADGSTGNASGSASDADPDPEGDGSGDSSGGDIKLDVGQDSMGDGGDGDSNECRNVDILFVIDNSGSMADNQEQLIASFPGFVEGIQDRLAFADSYHVGVVTSSPSVENPPPCQGHGDLVTQTIGAPESSNAVCGPFTSGGSYIDETEPDLESRFSCIAKVGAGGDDEEKPVTSLLTALSPGKAAAGACNEGFFRLDSLLVIVIITDEDDVVQECDPDEWPCFPSGTEGTPQQWHDTILTYKANIPENVVVLSLLGRELDNPCGATPASRLMSFTNDFGSNGYIGDICAQSYDQFFLETLPIIDQACENYVEPEG